MNQGFDSPRGYQIKEPAAITAAGSLLDRVVNGGPPLYPKGFQPKPPDGEHPVAELAKRESSLSTSSLSQSGQGTFCEEFRTSSSKRFPHAVHLYSYIGIYSPPLSFSSFFSLFSYRSPVSQVPPIQVGTPIRGSTILIITIQTATNSNSFRISLIPFCLRSPAGRQGEYRFPPSIAGYKHCAAHPVDPMSCLRSICRPFGRYPREGCW